MDDKRLEKTLQQLAQWCRDEAVKATKTADTMHLGHDGRIQTSAFFEDGRANAFSSCAMMIERTAREQK